ncbi:MAG TPA: 2OG-Fe(II) oxygenase [Allosphingosinicella sp.]|jgi:predicted 2-oxoglutarate/Fe(II)-dependent dioxygenase YbiX
MADEPLREDGEARLALGLKRLGSPGQAAEGIALIEAECEAGSAEAAAAVATLEAMGAARPQSWQRALDYLELAANRGSPRAQAQLRILARSAEGADWSRLRAAVDIAALTAPPPRRPISEQPRIRVIESFASPVECDWVTAIPQGRLNPAWVWDPQTGENRPDSSRTNRGLDLGAAEMDVVVQVLRARIAAAANLPLPVFEPAQIMHYRPGEEFRPHHDYLDPGQAGDRTQIARLGQRIATFLLYLNDDYEGGETEFLKTGFRYRGRKGDALLFANVDSARAPDPLTTHAGRPPTSGEKWILSQWIRDRSPAPA